MYVYKYIYIYIYMYMYICICVYMHIYNSTQSRLSSLPVGEPLLYSNSVLHSMRRDVHVC